MLAIAFAMLLILVLAGLVLVYAAFPHRGEQVPAVPWLGEAMERAADSLPVLPEEGQDGEWSLSAAPTQREA